MIIWSLALLFMINSMMIKGMPVEDECDLIFCSNVYDPVCAMMNTMNGSTVTRKYQNVCHMHKAKCRLKDIPDTDLHQIAGFVCNIKEKRIYSGRRVNDFSIVGAHQACNHTCPTYCIDTYEPACAQIWTPGMKKYVYRPMINHCHIDLFSCALAVNVTIHALGRCYKNPAGLLFMTQVAALKSLRLLDDNVASNSGGVGSAANSLPSAHHAVTT